MAKKRAERAASESGRHVEARAWILRGDTDAEIAAALKISAATVARERRKSQDRGVEPGLFMRADQAAWVLGVTARRMRAICVRWSIGRRDGAAGLWRIRSDQLIRYAFSERSGQAARK